MAVEYIVRQEVNGKYSSFTISDISQADLKKIINLMIGNVKVFKSSGSTNTTKSVPYPSKLNTKVFTSGTKVGSVYDREAWSIIHIADGKGLKDVRALKGNLHASFHTSKKATYVNLFSDKRS